jgi:transcriptional regulator NrdR family protein
MDDVIATIGIKCPRCGHPECRVRDSRPRADGSILRRRACVACKLRFKTKEHRLEMERETMVREERLIVALAMANEAIKALTSAVCEFETYVERAKWER